MQIDIPTERNIVLNADRHTDREEHILNADRHTDIEEHIFLMQTNTVMDIVNTMFYKTMHLIRYTLN